MVGRGSKQVTKVVEHSFFIFGQTGRANSVTLQIRPRDYKSFFFFFFFFVLNPAELEICPASKSQITNNCKFFLAKHI